MLTKVIISLLFTLIFSLFSMHLMSELYPG